jgi:hypothetical protein
MSGDFCSEALTPTLSREAGEGVMNPTLSRGAGEGVSTC